MQPLRIGTTLEEERSTRSSSAVVATLALLAAGLTALITRRYALASLSPARAGDMTVTTPRAGRLLSVAPDRRALARI